MEVAGWSRRLWSWCPSDGYWKDQTSLRLASWSWFLIVHSACGDSATFKKIMAFFFTFFTLKDWHFFAIVFFRPFSYLKRGTVVNCPIFNYTVELWILVRSIFVASVNINMTISSHVVWFFFERTWKTTQGWRFENNVKKWVSSSMASFSNLFCVLGSVHPEN